MTNGSSKSVPEIITDLKNEFKEFVATRVAMLNSEVGEKLSSIKSGIPALVIGLVFLLTAWFVLTALLVSVIATALPAPWNYVMAMAIVVVMYLAIGLIAALTGWKRITRTGLKPERTIRMLKQDQIWLETEANTQL